MADADGFDWLCGQLEQKTSLDRLEARGTVRLALKGAGLDPRTVTVDQLQVVIEKVMATELTARGVEDVRHVCSSLTSSLSAAAGALTREHTGESPDAVFSRLGGRTGTR